MSDDPASPQWSEMFAKCPEQPDPLPSRRIFGRRIKFIWGASRVIRGQWLLGLVGRYDRGDGRRWEGLAFSVRGMLLWGLGLGVASYFSGAAAVHAVRSRSPYNLVRYTDVLLWPVQRARMRELTGRAFLAEGLVDLRVKRYAEGIRRLRIGPTCIRRIRRRDARSPNSNCGAASGRRRCRR